MVFQLLLCHNKLSQNLLAGNGNHFFPPAYKCCGSGIWSVLSEDSFTVLQEIWGLSWEWLRVRSWNCLEASQAWHLCWDDLKRCAEVSAHVWAFLTAWKPQHGWIYGFQALNGNYVALFDVALEATLYRSKL